MDPDQSACWHAEPKGMSFRQAAQTDVDALVLTEGKYRGYEPG